MTSSASANALDGGELLAAADGVGEVAELQRELGLGAAAAGHLPVEQRRADDAERVLDGALDLVNDVFGAAAEDERDGLGLFDVLDEDALVAADVLLCDGAGEAEVVRLDVVEVGDDAAAGRGRGA